jgi:septum formation protein
MSTADASPASPPAEPLVCLASASPRRRELLIQIGVPHCVHPAQLDEARRGAESPREYVLRLARAKALAVQPAARALPVLAADTAVVLDGTVFGKPRDRAEGLDMLGALSGRTHVVLTAVALAHGGRLDTALSASEVRLRSLSPDERAAYWESGEPQDKAGAYAIQGRGAVFIEWLQGSYSGVMGLPLYEVAQLLRAIGIPAWLPQGSAA